MPGGKKVLIIDDESDAIEIVKAMLSEAEGVSVLSETNADNGLKKAKDTMPDLIILDVQMPKKNGFEVFTELKSDVVTRDIPVVMLTGIGEKTGISFSKTDMGGFLSTEPDAYLEKPIDADTLLSTVGRLIG